MKNASGKTGTRLWTLTCSAIVGCVMLATCANAATQAAREVTSNVISISGDRRTLANVKMQILGVHVSPRKSGLVNNFSPDLTPLAPAPALESSGILTTPNLLTVPGPGYYPSDLSKASASAPVMGAAQSHALFVDCPADDCWGTPDPRTFLTNLGASKMIHVTDQYTGLTTNGRYTVGSAFNITYPIYTILGDNDIVAILHLAVSATGLSGLGHIYHVFLPRHVDVCVGQGGKCYSPDIPSMFALCAYHSGVKFSDIAQPVYFTVEPYQGDGCGVAQTPTPSPNGLLIDSTANLLSHEMFETITDPDAASSFVVRRSLREAGAEVADVCEDPLFRYPDSFIAARFYRIQLEYSNTYHACANVP